MSLPEVVVGCAKYRRLLLYAERRVSDAVQSAWLAGRLWVVLLLLIPYAVGSLLLAVATQGLLDRPLRSLDERQVQVRRSLFREPYVTGATLGLAGGLVVAVATLADDALMMGLLLAVFGLLFGLPSMVLGWRMPADLADDE